MLGQALIVIGQTHCLQCFVEKALYMFIQTSILHLYYIPINK